LGAFKTEVICGGFTRRDTTNNKQTTNKQQKTMNNQAPSLAMHCIPPTHPEL
jgi:hypothetical protein